MRILYVTTIGGTMAFFKSIIQNLIDEGNKVDIATNEAISKVPDFFRLLGCKIYHISTSRSPFNFGNLLAIKQLKSIAKDYDIVHCHTPLAGMATRIGCRKLRKKYGLKVIYTAHGFHFYKGAPKKNWFVYYPIERICSKWTDVLITINKEDFEFAKKKMKSKSIKYIFGVGIDTKKFSMTNIDKIKKRIELGISSDAYLILSVGELNKNKNHQSVIRAISRLKDKSIVYMVAGIGSQMDSLKKLANDLHVNLKLLGYRNDVNELYKVADLYIHPSLREGLPVSVMESLASGCPTIGSKIRGNVDLIDSQNLFNPLDIEQIASLIAKKTCNIDSNYISYDKSTINKEMLSIYNNINKL